MSGRSTDEPAGCRRLSTGDNSSEEGEDEDIVKINLSALESEQQRAARLEKACESSMKDRHCFEIYLPKGLEQHKDWSFSTRECFRDWDWDITLSNELVCVNDDEVDYELRRIFDAQPHYSSHRRSRMRKSLECYASITFQLATTDENGDEVKNQEQVTLPKSLSLPEQNPYYFYFYPARNHSYSDYTFLEGCANSYLTRAEFFEINALSPMKLVIELFDVQTHDVIYLSVPPSISSPTDCILALSRDSYDIYYCDKSMLSLYSAYFRRLFSEENSDPKKIFPVDVDDEVSEMEDFLTMIHKQYSPITDYNVNDRLVLCDRYEAPLLMQACENHLRTVSRFSVEEKLSYANTYGLVALRRHIFDSGEFWSLPMHCDLQDQTKAMMFDRLVQGSRGLLEIPSGNRVQARENDEFQYVSDTE